MKTPADLAAIRVAKKHLVAMRHDNEDSTKLIVGMGTAGISAGARPVMNALMAEILNQDLSEHVVVYPSDLGDVPGAPVLVVQVPGEAKVTYVNVKPEYAARIISEHVVGKKVIDEFLQK